MDYTRWLVRTVDQHCPAVRHAIFHWLGDGDEWLWCQWTWRTLSLLEEKTMSNDQPELVVPPFSQLGSEVEPPSTGRVVLLLAGVPAGDELVRSGRAG